MLKLEHPIYDVIRSTFQPLISKLKRVASKVVITPYFLEDETSMQQKVKYTYTLHKQYQEKETFMR